MAPRLVLRTAHCTQGQSEFSSVTLLAGHRHGCTCAAPGLHLMQSGCVLLRHDLQGRVFGFARDEGEARHPLSRRAMNAGRGRWESFQPRFRNRITTLYTVHNVVGCLSKKHQQTLESAFSGVLFLPNNHLLTPEPRLVLRFVAGVDYVAFHFHSRRHQVVFHRPGVFHHD